LSSPLWDVSWDMAKRIPKNVADLQRLLYEYFPDEKPSSLSVRYPNTVEDLVFRGSTEPKDPKYVMPYLFPTASMEWVRKQLPPLERKELGVVRVSDVVKAMWLMIYRGPVVNLASLHKKRVKKMKSLLFGEGGKKIAEKALARKIGVESAKELMRKLFVVKKFIEDSSAANEDEDALRSAAGRTIGEFIELRLARPKKFTRFTRWTRTRK